MGPQNRCDFLWGSPGKRSYSLKSGQLSCGLWEGRAQLLTPNSLFQRFFPRKHEPAKNAPNQNLPVCMLGEIYWTTSLFWECLDVVVSSGFNSTRAQFLCMSLPASGLKAPTGCGHRHWRPKMTENRRPSVDETNQANQESPSIFYHPNSLRDDGMSPAPRCDASTPPCSE